MIIRGEVITGRSLGRTLGFPTANVAIKEELQVENGVYFSKARVNGSEYSAVTNIGMKPTVGGDKRSLECHLLNFSGDLYGLELEVELIEKLRDEQCFESIEALKRQIELDVKIAKLK